MPFQRHYAFEALFDASSMILTLWKEQHLLSNMRHIRVCAQLAAEEQFNSEDGFGEPVEVPPANCWSLKQARLVSNRNICVCMQADMHAEAAAVELLACHAIPTSLICFQGEMRGTTQVCAQLRTRVVQACVDVIMTVGDECDE
jgi:hypothetical protein